MLNGVEALLLLQLFCFRAEAEHSCSLCNCLAKSSSWCDQHVFPRAKADGKLIVSHVKEVEVVSRNDFLPLRKWPIRIIKFINNLELKIVQTESLIPIERDLESFHIEDCPLLHTVQPCSITNKAVFLHTISIKNTSLSTLQFLFSLQLPVLHTIIVKESPIQFLQYGLLHGMPNLGTIILQNTKIKSIDKCTFHSKVLHGTLQSMCLCGNALDCDCTNTYLRSIPAFYHPSESCSCTKTHCQIPSPANPATSIQEVANYPVSEACRISEQTECAYLYVPDKCNILGRNQNAASNDTGESELSNVPLPSICVQNSDCGPNGFCVKGRCSPLCRACEDPHSNCVGDLCVCFTSHIRFDTECGEGDELFKLSCDGNADCQSTDKCIDSVCITPCTSSRDCLVAHSGCVNSLCICSSGALVSASGCPQETTVKVTTLPPQIDANLLYGIIGTVGGAVGITVLCVGLGLLRTKLYKSPTPQITSIKRGSRNALKSGRSHMPRSGREVSTLKLITQQLVNENNSRKHNGSRMKLSTGKSGKHGTPSEYFEPTSSSISTTSEKSSKSRKKSNKHNSKSGGHKSSDKKKTNTLTVASAKRSTSRSSMLSKK